MTLIDLLILPFKLIFKILSLIFGGLFKILGKTIKNIFNLNYKAVTKIIQDKNKEKKMRKIMKIDRVSVGENL